MKTSVLHHEHKKCICVLVSTLPFSFFRVDPIPYDTPKPAGHTRFVCVSDTHSRTDGIQMPYGDVLLHMGDFTELGLPSEVKKFNDWLGTNLLNAHTHSQAGWTHASFSHAKALTHAGSREGERMKA